MAQTIEERYVQAQGKLAQYDCREAVSLLDDLMAERETLIRRVEELEELYYHPYPED